MIHPLNKRFYMNDRRLNELKYAQIKFVLKSEGFKLSDSQIKAKKDAWRNEIDRLLKEQADIHCKGYGKWKLHYMINFKKDYTTLNVYQAMSLVQREMLNDQKKPLEAPRLDSRPSLPQKRVRFESSRKISSESDEQPTENNLIEAKQPSKVVITKDKMKKVTRKMYSKKYLGDITDDEKGQVSEEEKMPEQKVSFVSKLESLGDPSFNQDLKVRKASK